MPKEDKEQKFTKMAVWFLIVIFLVVIAQSFIKYYLNKDFLLVDKIYCLNNEENCFAPDSEDEDPYKVLIFDKSVTLACTEKDESCEIDNICGTSSIEKCKMIGCDDDLDVIPEGYTTSEECFMKK